jgi:transposase
LVQALLERAQKDAAVIQYKEDKIQALTYELSHLRRTRYGVKSEALSQLQKDLFEDTWNEDLAAAEAELEKLADNEPVAAVCKPKRSRAGRQPLPEHLPRIEFRHEPDSCQCGQCCSELIKIREDVTEQLDVVPAVFTVHRHLCPMGTFARSTPAKHVKLSSPHPFQPP